MKCSTRMKLMRRKKTRAKVVIRRKMKKLPQLKVKLQMTKKRDVKAMQMAKKKTQLRLESNAFTTTTAQTSSDGSFSCPICGAQFTSLANMQLHAEDCNA
uniref:C2H2-type domain-containing protein n=1 Tax=Anopheles coluzzii TaxID=1518534 RepID=A0A8W7P2X7_ANOCL